ncbi:DUF2231 domain-containing protein [Phytohabitans flavus]|uniref:Membrane protein n=1 Tax=Phytohabitans flavus TaxID=1076124 RepID=A0A6F8XUC9_9ACTN|nr:DUF2231 domain-containing protein [Phytohabitans flavus]BCB77436.1 membrane protein [Phytohabitans flavus]
MQTRIRALGHTVHPMLVVFPLGLFITGTIFDLIHLITDKGTFGQVGFWMISAGIIGAVLAALTGFLDWTSIPSRTRAKRVGRVHGGLNSLMLLLFVIAWLIRVDNPSRAAGGGTFALEVVGVVIGGAAAWLGGELVDRLGIGVHDGANPNAPSSLTGRDAGAVGQTGRRPRASRA